MEKGFKVVEKFENVNIHYSDFMERFIVLWPKGDGSSSCNRFTSTAEAKQFITEQQMKKEGVQITIPWYLKEALDA